MEDRQLKLIAAAATAGAVDCSSYDYSARWWSNLAIRTALYSDKVESEVYKLHVQQRLAQLSSGLYDSDKVSEAVTKIIRMYSSLIVPWHMAGHDEAITSNRLMAIWYMNYAPEMLNG